MFLSKDGYKVVWWVGAVCICLLACVMFFTATMQTRIDGPIRGDARDYVAYAFNLDTYGVYSRVWPGLTAEVPPSDALRSPGYPYLLSFFVSSDQQDFAIEWVLLLQACLGVFTLVVYLALYRRFMGVGWSLCAGLFTAISPHLINASVYVLTESLFTFLLGLHLLVLEKAFRLRSLRWTMLAGVLLALSFLVRPTTQYLFLAYVAAILFWFGLSAREYWRYLLWFMLPIILAASAWTVRNELAIGRASDPTLAANFLQHGMYINMMYEGHPETYGYPYRYDPLNQDIAGNVGKVVEVIERNFLKEPRRYLAWCLVGKPMELFSWSLTESVGDAFIFAPVYSPYFDQPIFQISHVVAQAMHPVLMLMGVIGAFFAVFGRNKNYVAALLGVVLLYFLAFHMIGAPFPRYSIPLRPISYGLAFFTMHKLSTWIYMRIKALI